MPSNGAGTGCNDTGVFIIATLQAPVVGPSSWYLYTVSPKEAVHKSLACSRHASAMATRHFAHADKTKSSCFQ